MNNSGSDTIDASGGGDGAGDGGGGTWVGVVLVSQANSIGPTLSQSCRIASIKAMSLVPTLLRVLDLCWPTSDLPLY